jgi:hypothetical protein
MLPRRTTFRGAFLLLAYTIFASFSLLPHTSYAQSYKPELTVQSGNSFLDGRALYILSGGTVKGMVSGQCFMVDLSVSWSTANPTYTPLTLTTGSNWFPSTMTADGQKWFVMIKGTGYLFDRASGRWAPLFTYPSASQLWARSAATDPETGKIFVPSQYLKPDGTYGMLVVDPKDGSISSDTWDFNLPDQTTYAITWNAYLKSLLYAADNVMYSYSQVGGWRNFNNPPGQRASNAFCMVSSTTGNKVVMFGGYSKSLNATVGDIFILNTTTLTWKQGPSAAARDVRRSPACAISNDQFIVWGGDTGNTQTIVPPENIMLVYNLQTNAWVTNYTAAAEPPGLPTLGLLPSPTGSVSPSPSPSATGLPSANASSPQENDNTGVIIGAVGAGIALGLILGGVFMYRARKARSTQAEEDGDPPAPSELSGDIPPAIPHYRRRGSLGSDQNLVTRPFIQPYNPSATLPYHYPAATNIVYVNAPLYDSKHPGDGTDTRRTVQEGIAGAPHVSENPHSSEPITAPESASTYQMYYLSGPEISNRGY